MEHNNKTRKYITFNYPIQTDGGKTLLTGIRQVKESSNKVYISGFYEYEDGSKTDAFVFKGNLNSEDKKDQDLWYVLNYPSTLGRTVTATNLYGPNNGCEGKIQVVGNYTTKETKKYTIGCLYEGYLSGKGKWTTLIPSFSSDTTLNTIAHSTNGNLVVGNYDTELIQGKAFIYDILKKKYYDIIKPNAKSITAYGIWYNDDHSQTYTICGGYSDLDSISGIDSGYLVDWNNITHSFENWKSYSYNNQPKNTLITHFDGITSDGNGGYNLTGDWIGRSEDSLVRLRRDNIESNSSKLGFFANVKRKKNGNFNKAKWSEVSFPGKKTLTSGNSVYNDIVIGVYTVPQNKSIYGYVSYVCECESN